MPCPEYQPVLVPYGEGQGGGGAVITSLPSLAQFLSAHPAAMIARLTSVKGSSPRAEGTAMLVSGEAIWGTIGGGALEYMVIAKARQMLRDGRHEAALDVPLGPEIGQCCGGRVEVTLRWLDQHAARSLAAEVGAAAEAQPNVFVFGAGHVGHALARALALLPVRTHVIDTRPDELRGLPEAVEALAVALPEAVVRSAPSGSAFVILTHDHALDFLIAAEALKRDDAVYVGMVGSKTKRAKFSSWFVSTGGDADRVRRLTLPIGQQGLGDKRPEVIAALAAAEIMVHIGRGAGLVHARSTTGDERGAMNGR